MAQSSTYDNFQTCCMLTSLENNSPNTKLEFAIKSLFYAAQTYGLAASISYDFLRCNAKKQVSTKITSSTLGYRLVCACDQLYSPPV